MKNILLPTDFSENSWNAIQYALQFYENDNCNFFIHHVNRLSNLVGEDAPYISDKEAIEAIYIKPAKLKLTEIMKRIAKEFPKNEKHKFYTNSDFNFFIESIREQLEQKEIDAIVIGTKGASGLRKLMVGSNTGDIIKKVKCTTLVIPENAAYIKPKEIAFPTDLSLLYNLNILNPISETLEAFDSALRVLHVSKNKVQLNDNQTKNKDLLNDFFGEHEHSFHFLTGKKIEDSIECFVQSRNIDLIAMVAKNLNYFQKILFHPTVEEISYHTDIPFLVLHE